MGKVIAGIVIITLAVITAIVVLYLRHRKSKETAQEKGWALKGDLNARQERVLSSQNFAAETLLLSLLAPPSDLSGEMTILTRAHRDSIGKWLAQQSASSSSRTKKGIELS